MNDRFKLEEAISDILSTNEELESVIYRIGDCKTAPTEDQLLNMLIGIVELLVSKIYKITAFLFAILYNIIQLHYCRKNL